MKKLLSVFLLLACNNDSGRVAQLESALKECRAQAATQTAEAGQPVPAPATTMASTTAVKPIAIAQSDKPTVAAVNYSQSWDDVKAEFDWVSGDVTDDHSPSEPGGTAQVALVPLKLHREGEEYVSTEEAERRLAAQGFRPATDRELRAFAKANPDYQRQFGVVALGSSWVIPDGSRLVLCLNDWRGERGLYLLWTGHVWSSLWRFLAVRK